MLMQLGSGLKCKGDLMQDYDEWRSLRCGRYYYPSNLQQGEPDVATDKMLAINQSHYPERAAVLAAVS